MPLVELRGHTSFVFTVAFNASANLLVSGGFDENVKMWDPRTGTCVSTIPAHSEPITGVSFNRDSTCIASSSFDGLVRVWDTATSSCLRTFYAEGNPPVSSVKFSPNGKFVLAGTLDDKLRLWNVSNINGDGGCAKTYLGHSNTKFCINSAFSVANKEKQRIITGSEDGGVYIYGINDRELKQKVRR
jgi:COMPASS component SWD3